MSKVVLQIKDEVNCTFAGLSAEHRKHLNKKSKIFNPANRYITSVRLGRWDGCEAYFSIGGNTYINLLPDIIEYLAEQNVNIEIEDLRTYNRDFQFDPIDVNYLSDIVWPEGHDMVGQPIVLRDHQAEAANVFLTNHQSIASLPTSSGKSLLTAVLSKKVEKYGRSIVIVPNKDLITQTEKYYKYLGLDVGVYYGDRKEFFKTHTICTWQSLEILTQTPIDIGLDEPVTFANFTQGVVAVIIDECVAAGTKISTPNGKVNIEDLKMGDWVYSYNENTQQFELDEVVKLHHNMMISSPEKMFKIVMEDDTFIEITGNHKVLTTRGWIEAKYLLVTDEILSFKP